MKPFRLQPAIFILLLAALTGCATFRVPSERAVTISAQPELKHYQGVITPALLLHHYSVIYQSGSIDTGQNRVHLNWPTAAPRPASLDPAKTYTFDLLIEKNWLQMGFSQVETFYTATLVRLSRDHRVLYDATLCPMHHVAMKRQRVPIFYGYIGPDVAFAQAMSSHFPNARAPAEGGCSPNPAHKETFIWVCPECEAAYKKYLATQ